MKAWQSILLIAAAAGATVYAIHAVRARGAISNAQMVALLPRGENTVFFADAAMLRRAGVLGLLAGSKAAAPEPEYTAFVQQTGFDYARDIEALAGSSDGRQLFFVLRGRFDWKRLREYATGHGGACRNGFCNAPASKPGRWASFLTIEDDVMGLAVGADRAAAYALSPRRDLEPVEIPADAAWLSVPRNVLANPAALPIGLQLFAVPLAQADHVLLSAGAAGDANAFVIRLEAQCDSPAKARIMRDRLEDRTSLVKRALTRESGAANPGDLTGLVAGGTFRQTDTKVFGNWPLRKELLQALQ